ncbi:hypothetical protein SLEP1_g18617 [Rubroshorea leprosula]|uniref:Uncharacterized protein n=1 Tax=Rubroshorea leprosula TaxID=152421 RepID=A0AAV5J9Y4_9ROSI|nr:hypothetical protein SLEP1_g18617 [Rubroshorea leprosula]
MIGGGEDRRTIAEERIGGPSADKKIDGREDRWKRRSADGRRMISGRSANDRRTIDEREDDENFSPAGCNGSHEFNGRDGSDGFQRVSTGHLLKRVEVFNRPVFRSGSGSTSSTGRAGPGPKNIS